MIASLDGTATAPADYIAIDETALIPAGSMGTTVTIPIVDGEVLLGMWQRVLFAELDQPRERRIFFHAQGV